MLLRQLRSIQKPHRQEGFTIIEALIALFVVSIGILGIGKLCATSLSETRLAAQYTTAIMRATEIIEMARANRSALETYAVDFGESPVSNDCTNLDGACSVDELATDDVARWKLDLGLTGQGLPRGDGRVVVEELEDGTLMTVSVRWGVDSADQTVEVTAWL